jgi:hypothetical protein
MVASERDNRERHAAPDHLAQNKLILVQHKKLIVVRRKKLKRINLWPRLQKKLAQSLEALGKLQLPTGGSAIRAKGSAPATYGI